eukprot:TRINITY_DN5037_c0_g1_i1.p1 TRINITY_DN5037_c0_g1~~TRINITY_DN5037_c0_g1_i1.p1  ORF type:complete len:471 (+),score=93.08 TRINITY_DN5037_c0_g1_i1:50-1462(+)
MDPQIPNVSSSDSQQNAARVRNESADNAPVRSFIPREFTSSARSHIGYLQYNHRPAEQRVFSPNPSIQKIQEQFMRQQESQRYTVNLIHDFLMTPQPQTPPRTFSNSTDASMQSKSRLSLKRPIGSEQRGMVDLESNLLSSSNLSAHDDDRSYPPSNEILSDDVRNSREGLSAPKAGELSSQKQLSPHPKRSRVQLSSSSEEEIVDRTWIEEYKQRHQPTRLRRSPPYQAYTPHSPPYAAKQGSSQMQASRTTASHMQEPSLTEVSQTTSFASPGLLDAKERVSEIYSIHLKEAEKRLQQNRKQCNKIYLENKLFRDRLLQHTVDDTNSVQSDESDFQGGSVRRCHKLKQSHDISQGVTWTKAVHNIPVQDQKYRGFTVEEDYENTAISPSHVGKYVGDDYDDTYARDRVMQHFLFDNPKDMTYKRAIATVTRYMRNSRYTAEKRIDQRLAYIMEVSQQEEAEKSRLSME